MRAHLPDLRLSDGERSTLAEIGKRLGRKGLQQVARIAKPDTILGWYRKLVAAKFDGSKQRRSPGRPRISPEIEDLVIRLAVVRYTDLAHYPLGRRKLRLGLRSDCGSVG